MLVQCLLLAALAQFAAATTLTFRMMAHERPCFYTWVQRPTEKLNIYIAVQSGGDYEIDYELLNPDGTVLSEEKKTTNVDLFFATKSPGEYKLCFSNTYASFHEKVIDFNLEVESEQENATENNPSLFSKTDPEALKAQAEESTKPMHSSVQNMVAAYGDIMRDLRYIRTRTNRNFDTVQSTEDRIFWFNIIQNGMILFVAFAQVVVIKTLFSKGGRPGAIRI
ncbi:emp24/gp25L/p24 family/GOLD [Chytriomyces cf. hyalinus JEL632]|nr:emp24/gp25L/p24 family/GOLD [Chytriomyces cf. hyalinus JEL632]